MPAPKTTPPVASLSPYPINSPVTDKNFMLRQDWQKWFNGLNLFLKSVLNFFDSRKSGLATLVAGTVFINNQNVSAKTSIRMTAQTASANAGFLSVAQVIQTNPPSLPINTIGFTITSSNAADDRTILYEIVEGF